MNGSNVVPNLSGSSLVMPVCRSWTDQPFAANKAPAGSLSQKIAPSTLKPCWLLAPKLRPILPSSPISLTSSASHVLIVDEEIVYGLVHATSIFSIEMCGKNAPSLKRVRHSVRGTGRNSKNASERSRPFDSSGL